MATHLTMEDMMRCGYGVVDETALPPVERQLFLRRRKAIELKFDGFNLKSITIQTGISDTEVCRLFKRYTGVDEFGRFNGEKALVPQKRLVEYSRRELRFEKRSEQQGGLSGILSLTLNTHPDVLEKFVAIVLRKKTDAYRGVKYKKTIYYAEFLRLLREDGVKDVEWPFSMPSGGKRSILKLINSILEGDFTSAAFAMGDDQGRAHVQVGNGYEPLIRPILPFDAVQVDAYKVDSIFTLQTKPESNVSVCFPISRFWLLAVVESASEAVLALKPVFSSETHAQDVVDVLADAVMGGWEPISELSIPGLMYPKNAGMPCYLIPQTKLALWGCLYLDNALQHHADVVSNQFRSKFGCSINFGQLKRPERRSAVENLFRQACQRFFHVLPSTTGSSPDNGRADTAEENAIRYRVDVEEASQVLDVVMASYNITPRSGHAYSLSPIEFLSQHFHDSDLIFPSVLDGAISALELSSKHRVCVVRGNAKKGVRPYIQLDKARYTSIELASRAELIGCRFTIKIDPKDYRYLQAYSQDGEYYGTLTVLGWWAHTKHSVITRSIINKALRNRVLECSVMDDIVLVWIHYLESKNTNSARLELQRMRRESSGPSTSLEVPAQAVNAEDNLEDSVLREPQRAAHTDKGKDPRFTLPGHLIPITGNKM
jgi:hypothetical protein